MRALLKGAAVCLLLSCSDIAYAGFTIDETATQQMIQEVDRLAGQLPVQGEELEPEVRKAVDLLQQRRYLESLAILREVIRRQPDHARARFVAANALIGVHRYDSARILLEQMLEKHPDHPGLLNNLAWLYATAESPDVRKPERAVALARRALMFEPNDYHIWSTMAEAHFANRDYVRSVRAAEEALRLSREQNAPAVQIATYEEQVSKCREAVLAFSIIE